MQVARQGRQGVKSDWELVRLICGGAVGFVKHSLRLGATSRRPRSCWKGACEPASLTCGSQGSVAGLVSLSDEVAGTVKRDAARRVVVLQVRANEAAG